MSGRSSTRWPFAPERLQSFVDIVDEHEPTTVADQARRFGCSRRAASLGFAHLEAQGFAAWTWRAGGRRAKLWSLT